MTPSSSTDDPRDDDAPPASEAFASSPETQPLPSDAHRDVRETLAHILEGLAAAFRTDGDGRLDRALAVMALSLTQYLHFPSALRLTVLGATGSGKTHLLKTIASLVNLPAAIIPVTDMAETAWRGAQFGDACRMLHPHLFERAAQSHRITVPTHTVELQSIVMLDEVDKLCTVAHDGTRLEGTAAAARIGKMQSLLPFLDPMSEIVVHYDDGSQPFRWSLKRSVVVCAGAFAMLEDRGTVSSSDLVRVGLSAELVDRMGPIIRLPPPGATARAYLAHRCIANVRFFASLFGVSITGVDALVGGMPAPGLEAPFVGVRGLQHHVEQRMLAALATALTDNVGTIDLGAFEEDA
ncbi:MAG TPA: AAA family ATPase [Gemmatimonadaceae bacterium]|nr:AAA family ATPase [Gemmatimonadaceae bacterium]